MRRWPNSRSAGRRDEGCVCACVVGSGAGPGRLQHGPLSCLLSVGENLQLLVDRPDGTYCFRLHNDRVYYVR